VRVALPRWIDRISQQKAEQGSAMTTDQHERPTSTDPQQGPRPAALADQLRWVHDMLRRDLGAIQRLAVRVTDGASAADVETELRTLQSNGPLFQLRVNCLSYCQTLASHHRNEDAVLFPAVRRAAPQLRGTVDRLEADHRVVASLLDDIDALADDLAGRPARQSLVDALDALSTNLLQHLDLEEATLQPILESWSSRPEDTPAEIRDEVARRER
jgi:iron-sulfur cluster repair protein YtfE (RIC family)